ncbi:hypothetical protein MKW98_008105, partial [Papaver atlanticum]
PMHEITFAMNDKPNLLGQLTSLLAERGLNIQEAHAFSTSDGYSLDVFVVYGWERDTEDLREAVMRDLLKLEFRSKSQVHPVSSVDNHEQRDGTGVWEIDVAQLEIRGIVASWLHGKVHEGTYCGQDVAIKIVDEEKVYDDSVEQEFRQEIYIIRQVRHKNAVQFIGACTKIPNFYIVTEFMSGGSVHDFLHHHGGVFELPSLLKTAIGISKAMNHMHQKRIIHRDLRTENLLMDEDQVVKVAEFGVARVQARSGAMTPETGTYRWMAPEVIQRKPYNHKADVFSFGILLWELLTGELPYGNLTAGQVIRGVVQEGLRPAIPEDTNEMLSGLIQSCWSQDPALRPDFSRIVDILRQIGI